MIIFPAIDLRAGRVVRLKQGRPEDETFYGDDPVLVALRWQNEGAEWLHIVNLDGAFGEGTQENVDAIEGIVGAVKIPIQLGGGLRDITALRAALDSGIARGIIGTAAVEDPEIVAQAIAELGAERLVVGIDARDGLVATHGWKQSSTIFATDFAKGMAQSGVKRVVYTDISRDGMLRGVDAQGMARLAQSSGLRVIASGGVANIQDIRALAEREGEGVEGVIVGQALYTGAVKLKEAINAGKAHHTLS